MSSKIKHITLHLSYDVGDGVMVLSFDGEAWKKFNKAHP